MFKNLFFAFFATGMEQILRIPPNHAIGEGINFLLIFHFFAEKEKS